MMSHELARILLGLPDLPVATHALNHTFASLNESNGTVKLGILTHCAGDHLVIGDLSRMNLNAPNYFVSKMLVGKAPWEWGESETPEMRQKNKRTIAELVERNRRHIEACRKNPGKWTP